MSWSEFWKIICVFVSLFLSFINAFHDLKWTNTFLQETVAYLKYKLSTIFSRGAEM